MEAALLSTLSHDNIVAVLDVFDNDACVQVLYRVTHQVGDYVLLARIWEIHNNPYK